ncbi:MAG: response regulator [Leptospiraceae bacterium]|nr:response regulator [Leptospiraceae bacterium]
MSIKRQLITSIALIHAILMIIFIVDLTSRQSRFLHEQNKAQAISLTRTMAINSVSWVLAKDYAGLDEIIQSMNEYPDLKYAFILDPDGRVLAHTNHVLVNQFASDALSRQLLARRAAVVVIVDSSHLIDVAVQITNQQQPIGWARIGISRHSIRDELSDIALDGLIYTIVAIIVGTLLAWFMARRLTHRLYQLMQGTAIIRSGVFHHRIEVKGGDEIGTLSHEFNFMLDEIEKSRQKAVAERKRAEQSDQLKSIFLANVSHEVRTPLHAILGYTEILQDSQIGAEQHKHLEIIRKSSLSLLAIIQDILDLSLIESDQLKIKTAPFFIAELFSTILDGEQVIRQKPHIRLDFQIDSNLKRPILADQNRIAQIVVNLINNAIKFTETGRIEYRARALQAKLEIKVSDTGPGIEKSALQQIFEPFRQEHDQINLRYHGTGLGLAISEKLTRLMQGSIRVWSRKGRIHGSVFIVQLPFEYASTDFITPPVTLKRISDRIASKAPADKGRILVVDDIDLNRLITTRILRRYGYKTLSALNGADAFECIKREADILLVLMDIQMPIMDGLMATRKIRQWEAEQAREPLPIIALSAAAYEDDKIKGLQAGMDAYITKPFQSQQLIDLIEYWLRIKSGLSE